MSPNIKQDTERGGEKRMKDSGGAERTLDCITFVLPDSHDIVKGKKKVREKKTKTKQKIIITSIRRDLGKKKKRLCFIHQLKTSEVQIGFDTFLVKKKEKKKKKAKPYKKFQYLFHIHFTTMELKMSF